MSRTSARSASEAHWLFIRRLPAGAVLVVAAAIAWNLINLHAETRAVSYLDDSSVHEQMVRFATAQFQGGHLPLTSWFPYLGLGSPQFLHYQSLPAMLTGLLGLVAGANTAFRWTLYLILSLWPLSIYLCSRLFGANRAAAAASAAMSPFLFSASGLGYEQKAYVWIGYGVWTQLWASFTLPLAWGLTWRALREGSGWFAAVALISLTTAFHFETGYLALIPLLLWPFVSSRGLLIRLRRGALLLCASLLSTAWVIVPLLANRNWAAINEPLQGTPLVNGYGLARLLHWLITGRILDAGRFPVLSLLFAVGAVLALARWRKDESGGALILMFVASLALASGRATFGSLVQIIPGSSDLFFRRFLMGMQLAALILAGLGAVSCWRAAARALASSSALRTRFASLRAKPRRATGAVLAGAAGIAVLAPAWTQLQSYDTQNSRQIEAQQISDRQQGALVDRLLGMALNGTGRVYAGGPSNFGKSFRVGQVAVYQYLEARDVDEVGYNLRTASLMTNPEFFFAERNPSNYDLFGIAYILLPATQRPPVRAVHMGCEGSYCLWRTSTRAYFHVGTIIGTLSETRRNTGRRNIALLRSRLASNGEYLRVRFGENRASAPLPSARPQPPVGAVEHDNIALKRGQALAHVQMRAPGVVVLSASYDPGWGARVDGRPRRTLMVAPALVAVSVPAGAHRVAFQYRGYGGYAWLFSLGVATLGSVLAYDVTRRRRMRTAPSRAQRGSS